MRGKFMKKLTAYVLAAAMAVSTPMTAFASGLADYFWISDGEDKGTDTDTGTGTNSGTQTGTVSTTDTNTTILQENAANIRGIKISPASVVMNAYESTTLEAEILYEDNSATSEEEKEALKNVIRWRTSDYNIVTVDAKKKDGMDKCPINAKKAGFATVTAGLDLDNDGVDDYLASVKVVVKRDIISIVWNVVPQDKPFYAGHTYDLHDFIIVNDEPADETDDIIFAIVQADSKTATVNGSGILTVDKKAVDTEITVSAQVPGLDPVETNLTIKKGVPVTSLIASNRGKAEVRFSDGKKELKPETDVLVTAVPSNTTDNIEWTSSNEKIVTVEKKSQDKQAEAVLTGVAVGKAKVTAVSTSGKKATFNVTVTAQLIRIDEVYINETNSTWSGKTTPVQIKRTPEQNVDKLKITVTDPTTAKASKFVKAKNYNIIPAANLKGNEVTVDVTVASTNKKEGIKTNVLHGVKVLQSDVKLNKVTRTPVAIGEDVNKKTERLNPSERVVTYYPHIDAAHSNPGSDAISWESSKESVATIENGKLKVVGQGTAKITVSSVWNDNGKYKTSKETFTVKSTPKCEEIVLKSDTAANVAGQKVTFNVKQQLPKKAADKITWYVNGQKQTNTKFATDKKLTYTIPTTANPGDEIKVLATTGSVATEATIYVMSPAKRITVPDDYKKGMNIQVGDKETIEFTVEPKSGSEKEPIVRYDVDKKGAAVVKVITLSDNSAEIWGIGTGKATVSAVTASGKKLNFKVTVTPETTTSN